MAQMVWDPIALRMVPVEQQQAIASLSPNLQRALMERSDAPMSAAAEAQFKGTGINPNLKKFGGPGVVAPPGVEPDGVNWDTKFGGYSSGIWDELNNLGKLATAATFAYTGAGLAGLAPAGVGTAGSGIGAAGGSTLGFEGAGLGAAGAGVGAGTAAAGGTAGSGAGGAAAAGGEELGGSPMWEWLDTIDTPGVSDATFENVLGPSVNSGGFGLPGGDIALTSAGSDAAALPFLSNAPAGSVFASGGSAPAINAFDLGDAINSGSFLDTLKNYGGAAYSTLKNLFAPSGAPTGTGIPGPFGNSALNAAFDATPFLLALHEANSQSNDLNGVLNQINADAYRRSVLNPFDIQTAYQRGALQQDLANRGVAGSSFGNNDLNNFDYLHGLERSDMASKASLAAAGLQGQLINQRNTNRNMLLGAGLNASAKLFSPQPDPFNLRYLMSQ